MNVRDWLVRRRPCPRSRADRWTGESPAKPTTSGPMQRSPTSTSCGRFAAGWTHSMPDSPCRPHADLIEFVDRSPGDTIAATPSIPAACAGSWGWRPTVDLQRGPGTSPCAGIWRTAGGGTGIRAGGFEGPPASGCAVRRLISTGCVPEGAASRPQRPARARHTPRACAH